MAQIINEQGFGSRLGEALGTGLGSGLSQGIHSILNQKMQGLQQRSRYSDLKRAGMADQAASFLSMFDPEQQIKLLQGQDISSLFEPAQQEQAQPQFAQALQQEQQPQQRPELAVLQQLNEPYQQQNPAQLVQQAMLGQKGKLNPQEALREFAQQQAQPNKVPDVTQQLLKTSKPVSKAAFGAPLKQILGERKQAFQEEKERRRQEHQDQQEIDKQTEPFYKDTVKELKKAHFENRNLDKLEKIVKGGTLPSPLLSNVVDVLKVKGYGPNLSFLKGKDAAVFNKLKQEWVKNVKDLFGGNPAAAEVTMYLESLPDLSQSDTAKLEVIDHMRQTNRIIEEKYKIMEDLIKANNNKRPRNLELLVNDRLQSRLEQLKNSMTNPPEDTAQKIIEDKKLPPIVRYKAMAEKFGIPLF